jgi:hypothetical protein
MDYTTFVAPEPRAANDVATFFALVEDFMREGLVILPAVVLAAPQDVFPLYCCYDDGEPPEYSDVEIVYRGVDAAAVRAAVEERHGAGRCVCVWFRCLNPEHPRLAEQLHLQRFLASTVECTVGLHLPRRPVSLPITDAHSDHGPQPIRGVPQYFELNGRFAPFAHDVKGTDIARVLERRWSGRLRFGTSID